MPGREGYAAVIFIEWLLSLFGWGSREVINAVRDELSLPPLPPPAPPEKERPADSFFVRELYYMEFHEPRRPILSFRAWVAETFGTDTDGESGEYLKDNFVFIRHGDGHRSKGVTPFAAIRNSVGTKATDGWMAICPPDWHPCDDPDYPYAAIIETIDGVTRGELYQHRQVSLNEEDQHVLFFNRHHQRRTGEEAGAEPGPCPVESLSGYSVRDAT